MEPQVGLVSGRLEEKEYGYKPGSRIYAGPNWGWQTPESYQKTVKMRSGGAFFDWLSTTVGDPIKQAIAPAVQTVAPVVSPIVEGVTGVLESIPIIGETLKAAEVTKETLRQQAAQRGIDPRVVDVGAMAAEELVGGTVGKAAGMAKKVISNLPTPPAPGLAPAMTGGVTPTPMQMQPMVKRGVFKLTLKDPENIPEGITRGSAKSPEWAPQMRDFYTRRAAIKEKLQSAASAKRKADYQEEAYNTVSTGMSRNPAADPEAYGSAKRFEQFKEQSEITPLTPTGKIKWQQQHHLFSKQESYQFVERMIELGDDDDVLALFIMAEDMDAVLGGRLSNMLNMEDLPHSVLHGSRRVDKRELQSAAMRNLVENAKSTDELMRMFRKYVTENVLPSKEEAKALKIIGKRLMAADKYEYLNEIRDKMYR